MTKLEYGMQLSPEPIRLSIGTIRKPRLKDIAHITFSTFNDYEVLLQLSPETFYTKLKGDDGVAYWNELSDDEKANLTLYDLVMQDAMLQGAFIEVFDFFFVETVVFSEGCFVLLKREVEHNGDNLVLDDVSGVIDQDNFAQVVDIIQQICCIKEEKESVENLKFKNDLAKKLYEKISRAREASKRKERGSVNFTLPNLISAVSNKHPSINPLNVWDLTVFQLFDSFNRLRTNTMFCIDSTRVSVWGDEKKTFDFALWYKNDYDKK